MSIPFITRNPTAQDERRLQLLMSTFTDGSGYERGSTGETRPGWRDIERVIAELLATNSIESKSIFDIVVPSTVSDSAYGASIKSKGFSRKNFLSLSAGGRVYMELCNSPAKLWDPIKNLGIHEGNFGNAAVAVQIGESILETVQSWYTNCGIGNIDLDKSVHITVSYSKPDKSGPSMYQLHTFNLNFPSRIIWRFKSAKCLSGYDPDEPSKVLFDWYGLSGGQLKYYPKTTKALYSSNPFTLIEAKKQTITDKAKQYWPEEWK